MWIGNKIKLLLATRRVNNLWLTFVWRHLNGFFTIKELRRIKKLYSLSVAWNEWAKRKSKQNMSEKVDNLLSTLFKERCHILIEGLRKTKHNKTRPYKKYITLPDEFKISWMDGPRNIKKRYYHTLKKIEKPGSKGCSNYCSRLFQRLPAPGYKRSRRNRRLECTPDHQWTKSRSGDQWDIWEAVYSPVGKDGYPERIFDKYTGEINKKVAAHWKENYDLVHIIKRDL